MSDPIRQPLLQRDAFNPPYNEPFWAGFKESIGTCLGYCCFLPPPLGTCGCCCNPYQVVDQGSRGIVQRYGRATRVLEPGMHYVNPISEEMISVDIKTHVKELANQEVITKDNLPVTIDGDIYYRRVDVTRSCFSIYDLEYAMDQLGHSTLRNVFGRSTLQECLDHREDLARNIQQIVGEQTKAWGVVVESIQIRDIKIPKHIQEMLASAATAAREADAKLITARADVSAAKLMREAADCLNTDAAMQIRLLEVYSKLALSENAKLIFMPSEMKSMTIPGIVGQQLH